MPRSILITGGQGQLGLALARHDWPADVELSSPDRNALNIAEKQSVERLVAQVGFDAIVNCAAYTAVDKAEDDADAAYAVNAKGAGWIARAARDADIPVIHVSTDYVFGAPIGRPRREDDPVDPQSVYGASKLAGEIAVAAGCDRHVILRTSWVVSPFRTNFVKTMLRLASDRDEIGVVADQFGCPTGADDIAQALASVVMRLIDDRDAPVGLVHFSNGGEASWADVAECVMAEAAVHDLPTATIRRICTSDFPTPAARPVDSRLDCARIASDFGVRARPWKTMIASTVAELARQQH